MTSHRVLPDLSNDNVALLILDMQRAFLDEEMPGETMPGRAILPDLLDLVGLARRAGIPIIHAITVYRRDGIDERPFSKSMNMLTRELHDGSRGVEIIPELTPLEGEYVIVKKKYSAFFMTDLELLLRALKIECLIITGVATNYCVRSTVHDAYFREFLAVVPRECVASFTKEEHEQSLSDIATGFGEVVALEGIRSTLESKLAAVS